MTLREYHEQMTQFIADNPEYIDFPVITSTDDEGNAFNHVIYGCTAGEYDGSYNGEFDSDSSNVNAVCIN